MLPGCIICFAKMHAQHFPFHNLPAKWQKQALCLKKMFSFCEVVPYRLGPYYIGSSENAATVVILKYCCNVV